MRWLLFVMLGTVSCAEPVILASGSLAKPVAQFPSRAEVEKLVPSDAPPELKGATGITDVDTWQMRAPSPTPAQYPDETSWDHLLTQAEQEHGNALSLSPQLRCAALEIARFYTAKGGMPDEGLRQHMLLRCGSTLPTHDFSYVFVQAPDRAAATQVDGALTPLVRKMLDARFQDPHGELALAGARANGRAVVVALGGHPLAELNDFSPLIQGDSVTVSGELKVAADHVLVLVNQGAYGVVRCVTDPLQHLPAFRATCPVLATDSATRVEVVARQEGRVLMRPAAELAVRRDEQAELEYGTGTYGTNQVVAGATEFRTQLFRDLNQTRRAAGLRLLALENKQADTNQRLAPFLFQAQRSGDAARADSLAVAMLAGWDVSGGLIRNGGFFVNTVNSTRNPSRWLTQALDSPVGRFMLLDPNSSQIAVAESDLLPSGMMALATTYAFFESDDHRPDEEAVLAELDRQRSAHGVGPAHRLPTEAALEEAGGQVAHNVTTAVSALQNAAQRLRSAHGKTVLGYSLETNDIKQIKFDPLFLDSSTLDVELVITHYRAPGAAWGQYVALWAVLDHGPTNRTAKSRVNAAPSQLGSVYHQPHAS